MTSTHPLLSVHGLSRRFGGIHAVSEFNISINKGEMVGLIGPNGAGKTTVFNLISGIYRPTAGKILLDGKNISGMAPHTVAALGISRTFQNIRLFREFTVLENVLVSHSPYCRYGFMEALFHKGGYQSYEKEIRSMAMETLEFFGLSSASNELARNLPYGLQRKLEMARAMALRPRLLLLDEPAAGMNQHESEELAGLIRILRNEYGVTVLLIEHQMKFVMGLCDRLNVMDFGVTIAEGSPSSIRDNPKVIEAYLGKKVVL